MLYDDADDDELKKKWKVIISGGSLLFLKDEFLVDFFNFPRWLMESLNLLQS